MKKLIMVVAIVCAAAFSQAATVGWTNAGLNNYAGDAYSVFVIGQNGVESIAQITALLDDGKAYSSYQYGGGVVAANGTANVLAGNSGLSLGAGTYESFFVLFDSATPTEGDKYIMVSGLASQTKVVTGTTASIAFGTGNIGTIVNNVSNWKSFGSAGPAVPEPTSGLLLLLGMAGLALKRKVA